MTAIAPSCGLGGNGGTMSGAVRSGVSYVPPFLPDELLYSVVCRYHRHTGAISYSHTALDLFGRDFIKASLSLPGGLDGLAERLFPDGPTGGADLARRLTLHRYYAAFASPSEAERGLAAQCSGGDAGAAVIMGVVAFIVREPRSLRFCLECLDDMEESVGECWWRRAHQLPGVLVCPTHGTPLRVSEVDFGRNGLNLLLGASRARCRPDAPALVADPSVEAAAFLREIAVRSETVLELGAVPMPLADRRAGYRDRLFGAGLMKSDRMLDVPRLLAAARPFFAPFGRLVHERFADDQGIGWWAYDLLRKSERKSPPVFHILMEMFLDSIGASDPFGTGPWHCPNPVGGHGRDPTIGVVRRVRTKTGLRGDFECPCGYSYQIRIGADGTPTKAKRRTFGPLLVPAVRELVEKGRNRREIELALGVDSQALCEIATRFCLPVDWPPVVRKRSAADGPRPWRPRPPRVKVAKPAPRRRPGPRRDWIAIDEELMGKLPSIVADLLGRVPYQRICRRRIERELGMADWINSRQSKLPRIVAAIAAVTETVEQFQWRRLHAVLADHERNAQRLYPWRLAKRAGLREGKWLPIIKEIIGGRT